MSAEKIGPQHLARKAVLYVRQSSTHQVLHNREGQALQYAMRDRLAPCNYPHLWPAQGRLDLRLRAMLESGKITRSGGTSKGSAQKDTLLREASKALIRQGKMWVIASGRTRGPGRVARRARRIAAAAIASGRLA